MSRDIHDVLFGDPEQVQIFATGLWERSFGIEGLSEDQAIDRVRNECSARVLGVGDDETLQAKILAEALFLARWAHCAFCRLQTSHTYAAALMATPVHRSMVADLQLPWSAFEVHVPSGLLVVGEDDYTRIRVRREESAVLITLYSTSNRSTYSSGSETGDLGAVLAADLDSDVEDRQLGRVGFLAKRLVAGLLLTMQNTDDFSERMVRGKRALKSRLTSAPSHRLVVIGKPLVLDVRNTIRAFLGSALPDPKRPSVQSYVIGHYRRQPVGAGGLDRRVIWIAPYWRGPEEGPILTRPRVIAERAVDGG